MGSIIPHRDTDKRLQRSIQGVTKAQVRWTERYFGLALGLLALLTLIVNAQGRAQFPFWSDEAYTTLAVRAQTWSEFLQINLRNEETPPFYFALLRIWAMLWGDSREGTLRLFSALCLAAAVPVVGWLGQQMWNRRIGLLSALLFAANPFAHYYGHEARAYALTLLLASLLFALAVHFIQRPTRLTWILYVLVGIMALYTNYFAVFVLAGLGTLGFLLLVRKGRAHLGGWVLAHVLIALTLLPWLTSLRYQMDVSASTLAPAERSAWQQYLLALLVLGGAFPDGSVIGQVLIALIACSLPLAVFRVLQIGRLHQRLFLLTTIVLPMIGVVLVFAGDGQFNPRYILICLPAYVLILAAGLDSAWRWSSLSRTLLAMVVVLSVAYGFVQEQDVRRQGGWDQIAQIVADDAQDGDAVFFAPPWAQAAFVVQYEGAPLPLYGATDFAEYYYERGNPFNQDIDLPALEAHLAQGQRAWIAWDRNFAHRPALPPGMTAEEHQFGTTTILLVTPEQTAESTP